MSKVLGTIAVAALISLCHVAGSETWYVDGHVPGSGDGTSWETALKTVQEGIGAALVGDTVIVAEWTYVENIRFGGRNIILRSANPSVPKIVSRTIIDGNRSGPVVALSGTENETCVLSGFTIRNGMTDEYGGGICGGTWDTHGHATIENNKITDNSSYSGAGVCDCYATIRGNYIAGNSAGSNGGGLLECGPTIRENIIIGNSAGDMGGGLCDCPAPIQSNLIARNHAYRGGGLYYCGGSIENNTIAANSASTEGGGLYKSLGTIHNCIIWGNNAHDGPQLHSSSLPTYSCVQGFTGGAKGNIGDDPRLVDWDGPDDDYRTYQDNDYHLSPDSPCIDAGENEEWMWHAVDLDGNSRILYGASSVAVDMGAYERYSLTVVEVKRSPGGLAEIMWASRPWDTYAIRSCPDLSRGQWTDDATVSSGGQLTTWADTDTVSERKFYRIEISEGPSN